MCACAMNMSRVPTRKVHCADQRGIGNDLVSQSGQDKLLHLTPGQNGVERESQAPYCGYDNVRPDKQRTLPERRIGMLTGVVHGKWFPDDDGQPGGGSHCPVGDYPHVPGGPHTVEPRHR